MNKISILLLCILLCGCKQNNHNLTMLVGTYTDTDSKGIYTFTFNEEDGTSTALTTTEVKNPSFLAVTPDQKMVYSVSEQSDGSSVSAFDFDKQTGTLDFRNSQLTKGRGPCHVTIVGKDVVSANYSSGTISVFPIDEQGNLQEANLLEFKENGPDSTRQEGSHLHSTQVSPDGKFLFAIDLGGDYIYRFPIANGKVADYNATKIKMPLGSGPRHFDFSKDHRFMYVINELSGSVVAYDYNNGDLMQIQEIQADTLYARGSADIHFSPDGKFLYASNRLQGDGIAIFKQDAKSGQLEKVGYQNTAIHPRNFAISPNGKYVLVACRDNDVVQVFARDVETGLLSDAHHDIKVPHAVCVILVQ